MAITISGTNGIVGAGFTVDNSGVSVTAGVGTFSSVQGSGANLTALPAANLTGTLPALAAASLTQIPAANIVGVCTSGLTKTGGFGGYVKLQTAAAEDLLANINFDNLDVATYKFFDLVGTFQPQTDSEHFRMRFRTGGASGSDVTSSDYGYGFTVPYPNNNTGATATSGQNQLLLSTTVGNATGEAISINMRISFADSSAPTNPKYLMNFVTWGGTYREQGNGFRAVDGSGHLYTASTIPTGFSVSFTSGGIEDYSYVLYGMKR